MKNYPELICLIAAYMSNTLVHADVLQVPSVYPTIQNAIDAAADGDEVHVSAGTYNESVNLLGKAIQLVGIDGAATTTIDATGLGGSTVVCNTNETFKSVISGFTITGGTGTLHPVWEMYHGGGVYVYLASPTIFDCVITGNQAEFAGGMWAQEYFSLISNVSFTNNQSTFLEFGGAGGLYLWDSSATVNDCVFENNHSTGPGGAVRTKIINDTSGHSVFQNCSFNSNSSDEFGGAVVTFNSTPTFNQCSFTNNESLDFAGALYIGGSIGEDEQVTLTECNFEMNISGTYGGAVRIAHTTVSFDNCDFSSNSAPIYGGAIAVTGVDGPANCSLSGSSIKNNNSAQGGAIYNLDSVISNLDSTVICDNGSDPIVGDWNDLGGNTLAVSCDFPCLGDINADGVINKDDLTILIETVVWAIRTAPP